MTEPSTTTTKKKRAFSCPKSAPIHTSRWAAYATAGAATAWCGPASAHADIIYSGPIDYTFNAAPGRISTHYFQLNEREHSLRGWHSRTARGVHGAATFSVIITENLEAGAIAGFVGNGFNMFNYASKLSYGQIINTRPFVVRYGRLAIPIGGEDTGLNAQWQQPGIGFVGFRFNGGSGEQYGWARLRVDGQPGNTFTLIDYAFADPGERITAGQTGTAPVPESGGSLGLLALGCAGLLAWRAWRGREAESPAQ